MDRATSYVAGSRHKDNCHWFFNQTSIEQTCNNGKSLTRSQALAAVAGLMSQDRYKCLAIEYVEAQQTSEVQVTLTSEAELAPELDW